MSSFYEGRSIVSKSNHDGVWQAGTAALMNPDGTSYVNKRWSGGRLSAVNYKTRMIDGDSNFNKVIILEHKLSTCPRILIL